MANVDGWTLPIPVYKVDIVFFNLVEKEFEGGKTASLVTIQHEQLNLDRYAEQNSM